MISIRAEFHFSSLFYLRLDSYQTTDCVYFWGTRASEGVEYGSKDYLDLPEFTLDSVKTKIKINEYSIGKK